LEGIGHDRQGELDMRAPRELGHDAAVAGVQSTWLETTELTTVRP